MNSRILPTLALFISVGMFFAYVNPTWRGPIAETKAAIALTDQALEAAEEYKMQQNALAAKRDSIDPESLRRLELFLPDSVDNVGLILDLNALAARSGLSLTNIDVVSNELTAPEGEQAASPIGSVNLTLSAAGTFSALETFLERIEASARLLDVQEIIVKGSSTGVYSYQMVIRLYWLR
jgi:hypothetical protein